MDWQNTIAVIYGGLWIVFTIAFVIILIWTIHKRHQEKKEEDIKNKEYKDY